MKSIKTTYVIDFSISVFSFFEYSFIYYKNANYIQELSNTNDQGGNLESTCSESLLLITFMSFCTESEEGTK